MKIKTIDLTPSWETAMRIYFHALEGSKGKKGYDAVYKSLKAETMRLAIAYDATKKAMKKKKIIS